LKQIASYGFMSNSDILFQMVVLDLMAAIIF